MYSRDRDTCFVLLLLQAELYGWFYCDDANGGASTGPVTSDALKSLISGGMLNSDTRVRGPSSLRLKLASFVLRLRAPCCPPAACTIHSIVYPAHAPEVRAQPRFCSPPSRKVAAQPPCARLAGVCCLPSSHATAWCAGAHGGDGDLEAPGADHGRVPLVPVGAACRGFVLFSSLFGRAGEGGVSAPLRPPPPRAHSPRHATQNGARPMLHVLCSEALSTPFVPTRCACFGFSPCCGCL